MTKSKQGPKYEYKMLLQISSHHLALYLSIHFQEGDEEGRRMAMDGNMNLVHRAKAGHSVREPLHQGRFFMPQSDVDSFLHEHGTRFNPTKKVSKFLLDQFIALFKFV